MIDKCKRCKKYSDNNKFLKAEGGKTIYGNYCTAFYWNLTNMTKIPESCFR